MELELKKLAVINEILENISDNPDKKIMQIYDMNEIEINNLCESYQLEIDFQLVESEMEMFIESASDKELMKNIDAVDKKFKDMQTSLKKLREKAESNDISSIDNKIEKIQSLRNELELVKKSNSPKLEIAKIIIKLIILAVAIAVLIYALTALSVYAYFHVSFISLSTLASITAGIKILDIGLLTLAVATTVVSMVDLLNTRKNLKDISVDIKEAMARKAEELKSLGEKLMKYN